MSSILLLSASGILSMISYSSLASFVKGYGYLALFLLMAMESASLPIPSEIVLPLAGYLSAQGLLNPNPFLAMVLSIIVVTIASFVGMEINYFLAYFVGKDIIYRHLSTFRIKKGSLDSFDRWFSSNGAFAVFIARFIPEVRGLVSLVAGFAFMDQKKFILYSIAGMLIWNTILVMFGYYALSTSNLTVIFIEVAAFAIAMYALYYFATKRIKKHGR